MSIDRNGMVADLYNMAARAWNEMLVRHNDPLELEYLIRYRDLRRHLEACLKFAVELVAR
jgi:hypothetical protein